MNEVVFQLAVVLAPGLVWTSVADALCTTLGKKSTTRTVTRAFGFAIVSYLVYFTGYYAGFRVWYGTWPHFFDSVQSAPAVSDLRVLRPKDVLFTSALALVLAILWSAGANRRVFSRAMQRLGVTRKYGDEGVWEYVLNLGTAGVEFVNFRDFESKIIYSGYVKAFSEGGRTREVLLEQVVVYDLDTGQELYQMPLLYVSRKAEFLHVEFPFVAEDAVCEARKGNPQERSMSHEPQIQAGSGISRSNDIGAAG